MSKLSEKKLAAALATYVDANKIAFNSLSITRDNIIGLTDKVGEITFLDTAFFDKLPELDGNDLPLGKTIEEWYQDLIETVDWNQDADGSRALKFYSPTYRPVCYDVTLGKKIIPISEPYNNVQRAVNNPAQAVAIVASIAKRLTDSYAAWKYGLKRHLLGVMCDKLVAAYDDATAYVDATTDIAEGTFYKQSTNYAVCVEARTATVGDTWADLIASGKLVEIKFVKELAIPVDTTTGEAFIKEMKKAVEQANDMSEGNSLNGNSIGASSGLSLYVKQGVMPSLEVDTMAGAVNLEKLAVGVEAKVIKDFGATTSNAYAILMDSRAVRLHTGYEALLDQQNGFGGFISLFKHSEHTGFISRNCFVRVFVVPAE